MTTENKIPTFNLILIHGVGSKHKDDLRRKFLGDRVGPFSSSEGSPSKITTWFNRTGPSVNVYEVFWANLRTGCDGLLQVLFLFPLKLLLGFSRIGADGWQETQCPAGQGLLAGKLMHFALFGVMIYLPALFFPSMHCFCLTGASKIIAIALSLLPTVAMVVYLSRYDRIIGRTSWLLFVFPVLAWLSKDWIEFEHSAKITALIVSATQWTATVLIALAILQLVVKQWSWNPQNGASPFLPPLVRILAIGLPFIILAGGAGALMWAINLAIYELLQNDVANVARDRWLWVYQSSLQYDLAVMEFVAGLTTFGFLLFLVAGPLYMLALPMLKAIPPQPERRLGRRIQDWLALSLVVFLVAILTTGSIYIVECVSSGTMYGLIPWLDSLLLWIASRFPSSEPIPGTAKELNAFVIYSASSLRLLGFLPGLQKKVRTVFEIISDVVFWLIPDGELATSKESAEELKDILNKIKISSVNGTKTVVLAYSQGSVIAANTIDSMSDANGISLVTIGSPIDSFYRRFFAIDVTPHKKFARSCSKKGVLWCNFNRKSDFIGGRIKGSKNYWIYGSFGETHFNYFREEKVLEKVTEILVENDPEKLPSTSKSESSDNRPPTSE